MKAAVAAQPGPPLVPAPFAFVGAGILATVGAQLFVTADDFTEMYYTLGLALPWVVNNLVQAPIAHPVAFLTLAVLLLLAPRVRVPRAWHRSIQALLGASVGLVMLYAVALVYLLPGVLLEVQKQLQQ